MQLKALLSFKQYGLNHLQGSLDSEVTEVLPPDRAFPSSLVFVSKQEMIQVALDRGVTSFIKTTALQAQFPASATLFEIPSVSLGLALVLPFFDKKSERFESSPTAIVHPTARLGEDVILGAYAVVGANTIIGQGCKIGSHVVIENNCVIGAKTILHPQVFIGASTEIGIQCEIHSHTTIGADGFGYVTNPADGTHHKIPQVGRVIIGDRVEIGANCAIDRATLTETRIRSGTKFDNLIHIAHNCDVGENSMITAQFGTAGSTQFGKNFTTGGQAGTGGHIKIADNVTLAGRTAALYDIEEPGTYGGMPAVKIQHYLKTSKALIDLPEMWKWWRKHTKENT